MKKGEKFEICAAIVLVVSLMIFLSACSTTQIDAPAQMSTEFSVIEGHLAMKPTLRNKGQQLIIYLGDRVDEEQIPPVTLEDAVTGEEIQAPVERPEIQQPKLDNLRKCGTQNAEEEHILAALKATLEEWSIGPEGKTLRLYGHFVEGSWNEHRWGVHFAFCYVGMRNDLTGEEDIIDTCYGDRMSDDFWRFLMNKSKDGVKRIPKAVF